MASETKYPQYSSDFWSEAERELWEMLLQDETNYCWNTAHPESEAYFTALEAAFPFDELLDMDIEARSQALFTQLDQLWEREVPEASTEIATSHSDILATLCQKFASRVPQVTLALIAKTAKDLVSSNLCLAERLVRCVNELSIGWTEEDLLVMARPLAYAMRGAETEAIETFLEKVREVPFEELSPMEKARLSLAISRYAFAELETTNDQ